MKPVKWIVPNTTSEHTSYNDYTTFSYKDVTPNGNFKHAKKLFISNITFPFVGYYICLEEGENAEDALKRDQIYLFVYDEQHLSVSMANSETVTVTQGSDAVIPCRPTSPDVVVKLTTFENEEVISFDVLYENEEYYRFNQKIGITTNATQEIGNKVFDCNYTRGSHKFEQQSVVLRVETKTDFVPKPYINESSGNHTEIGETLNLRCEIKTHNTISIKWETPSGPPDEERMNVSTLKDVNGVKSIELTIPNVKIIDKGLYTCFVSDIQDHKNNESLDVHVYGKGEHFINLTEPNGLYYIPENAGAEEVQWTLNFEAHPIPKFKWYDNNNTIIGEDHENKYSTGVDIDSKQVWIKIKNITVDDFGSYTLEAKNRYEKIEKKSLFLNITDKPTVKLESKLFLQINKSNIVKCVAKANPKPTFVWKLKKCQEFRCGFETLGEDTNPKQNKIKFTSYMKITPSFNGVISCEAFNSLGRDEDTKKFYVSDVKNGFDMYIKDDESIVVENDTLVVSRGETIQITCEASVTNYSKHIKLYHNNHIIESNDQYDVEEASTLLHHKRTVTIRNMETKNTGSYTCKIDGNGLFKNQKFENKLIIVVKDPLSPTILDSNMNDSKQINYPLSTEFKCKAVGIPKPIITWYKNGELFQTDERVTWNAEEGILRFNKTNSKDEGNYKCEAKNKMGITSITSKLIIKNKSQELSKGVKVAIIVVFVIIILLLFVAVGFIIVYKKKQYKLQRELSLAGLANFEKGAIESINPDIGIDDQAELLPYDKKWEFPIERLKLGKQLGSGAFGVVMKGVAKGLVEEEERTVVAVKMVKKNAEPAIIKALASELKIMVHLGKHINVVNLLGACTKNVVKRELLVIVEYCRFGNLHNYLFRHRGNFIDQIDQNNGLINYYIGLDALERTYSGTSSRSNPQSPGMNYAALACSKSTDLPNNSNEMGDYRANTNYTDHSALTEMTTVSMSPNFEQGEEVTSNNSIQPEWRSNYRGDYKGNVKPICTKDLLVWAFQVSRGMEYLASRKILHGDLAARNILLADNEVVKICDFGLAKTMYKNDNYKKKGDGPLPVKWMAIESIRDKVFSTQSDVWSFGIVLWEFFSLARTPYPGMEADEHLYHKLLDGYRMQAPEYSTKEIYKMMLDCWQPKPLARPSFPKLAERIGCMLEESVKKYYIDLNDPYLVMNTHRLEEGQSDYLAMISPPNFENLSSPQYINDIPMSPLGPLPTPGYLCMKPNNIFSPRLPNDNTVFNFDVDGRKQKNSLSSEGGSGPELAPMLHTQVESDCETPSTCTSPKEVGSFSNPSYHTPPVVGSEKENKMNNVNIVKTKDNYINMQQNKNSLKNKINEQNNPFIEVDEKKTNVHYVNDPSIWNSIDV